MSDNVGLSTPRGSGTSGYVQRNRAFIKPRDHTGPYAHPRDFLETQQKAKIRTQPDQGILEHDRKRAIEVRVFALRDQLEEQDEDEDEIERRCDALREQLTRESTAGRQQQQQQQQPSSSRRFKAHQVHEQARAKVAESERLRRALHISKDYEEGGHWRRQEEKQALKRKKEEEEEEERRRERERAQSEEGDGRAPPLRSVEDGTLGVGRRAVVRDNDSDSRSDSRSRSRSRSSSLSDRQRGREDGRRVRPRRGSARSESRSPSRSRSRTRSRSRSDGDRR